MGSHHHCTAYVNNARAYAIKLQTTLYSPSPSSDMLQTMTEMRRAVYCSRLHHLRVNTLLCQMARELDRDILLYALQYSKKNNQQNGGAIQHTSQHFRPWLTLVTCFGIIAIQEMLVRCHHQNQFDEQQFPLCLLPIVAV